MISFVFVRDAWHLRVIDLMPMHRFAVTVDRGGIDIQSQREAEKIVRVWCTYSMT